MSCDGMKYLVGLIGIFKKYASKDADTDHLNKSELKELLEKEFPVLINESSNPQEVKKVLDALDHDKDGQVDIMEYFVTICTLGICIDEEIKKAHCPKKK